MTFNKTLQEKLLNHIQKEGYNFSDDENALEENVEDILKNATLNFRDAEIDFSSSQKEKKPRRRLSKSDHSFTNESGEDKDELFREKIVHAEGSQSAKSKSRGWSVGGALGLSYQGSGALAGVSYSRSKSTSYIETEHKQYEREYEKTVRVPGRSVVKVAVIEQVKEFRCPVCGVEVTFEKDVSNETITCKVSRENKSSDKKKFKFGDVFKEATTINEKGGLVLKMDYDFVWSETSTCIHEYDPEPL